MFALERQKRIIDKLKEDGSVLVSQLALELGVTEETVRRDLEKLEKQEALLRTHGGAVPIAGTNYEYSLETRKNLNTESKARLAKEAVKHIVPGDTIFLDASTTTFYISKELKNMKNVTIVTNSLRVINELASTPDLKVISVGGIVSNNQSLVGIGAQNDIAEKYFANKMFFSSRGIAEDTGILESNEQEYGVKQCMLKNAGKKYFVCDKSKHGRVGFERLARFSEIDYVITEGSFGESFEQKLADEGVKVICVE